MIDEDDPYLAMAKSSKAIECGVKPGMLGANLSYIAHGLTKSSKVNKVGRFVNNNVDEKSVGSLANHFISKYAAVSKESI